MKEDDVLEAAAKALYTEEYADDPDADGWDDAPGWERYLFRRRALEADQAAVKN